MKQKKQILTLVCGVLSSACLYAIPAKKVVKTVTQPDGSVLEVRLSGDEFLRYYETSDGMPLKEYNGVYYYAALSADSLAASDCMAHEVYLRGEQEQRVADSLKNDFLQRFQPVRAERRVRSGIQQAPTRAVTRSFGGQILPEPMEGKKKGLVILVNFKDVAMQTKNPHETFYRYMNEEGYNENGQSGSVRDYFLSQSYGKFDFSFDVVGPVTLPNDMSYYGANVQDFDVRPGEMALDACKLVKDSVNFADYDWDGNGEAEQIFIVYAGYAESNGAPANTIWPHQSYVQERNGSSLVLNGTKIGKYACSSELTGVSGTKLSGIGTMCHEFSHCFGIPDFYDVYGNNFGMSVWSLMDYGCYNNNGNTPIGYTAYERMMCGWLEPIILTDTVSVEKMPPLSDEPVAYAIMNEANADEYYLLENRQKKGWDTYMYGHGLMVVHVDYDSGVWAFNTVNTKSSRQRMTIIPADNQLQAVMSSFSGDLFPGTSGTTELTDTGTPRALLHTPNVSGLGLMSKPVYNITESDGYISFDFLKKKEKTGIAEVLSNETEAKTWQVYRPDGSYAGRVPSVEAVSHYVPGLYLLRCGKEVRKILVR